MSEDQNRAVELPSTRMRVGFGSVTKAKSHLGLTLSCLAGAEEQLQFQVPEAKEQASPAAPELPAHKDLEKSRQVQDLVRELVLVLVRA